MKKNNITLSPQAITAIAALQHANGTFEYYRKSLDALQTVVLGFSDEIGMSDSEAMHMLRALDAIRSDITAIATSGKDSGDAEMPAEDVAERVNEAFPIEKFPVDGADSEEISDSNYHKCDKCDYES